MLRDCTAGPLQQCVAIKQGDMLDVCLHDATIVYAYLLPKGVLPSLL